MEKTEPKVKFLTGKLKEAKGLNNRPQTGDNRTIVQLVPVDGEYSTIKGNDEISKTWPKAKDSYRTWWRGQVGFKLGEINTSQVQSDTEIVSIVAVEDKVNLDAVKAGLEKLGKQCEVSKNNIHINKFGNKKTWAKALEYINDSLVARGLLVIVYDGE